MRIKFYSLLSISIALVATAFSINIIERHRKGIGTAFHFKPVFTSGQPSGTQLTTTTNWDTKAEFYPTCNGADYVCDVLPPASEKIKTREQCVAAIRANGKAIPITWTRTNEMYFW